MRFTNKRLVDGPLVPGHMVVLPRDVFPPLQDEDLVQARGPLARWWWRLESIGVAVDVGVIVLGL